MNALLQRWRAMPLRTRAVLFVGLVSAVLVGMAGREHIARRTGEEVVLRTRPVDPRDIVRGAYVALDYEIERIHLPDLPTPADPSDWRESDRLWLTLRKKDGAWAPYALGAGRNARVPGDVALRARFVRREDFAAEAPAGANMPIDVLLDIGADHYYAEEHAAKDLEARARQSPIDVVLAVTSDGRATIKGLIIDGKRQDETFF